MPLRVLRSRYLILVCAVLMQTCLGATYSWAVFVKSLKDLEGIGQGSVQTPFTLFYMVFPATALFAGPLMTRLTPRWSAVLGGVVFGVGWITASLGQHAFAFTVVGIGVLGGIGVGLAYVVPIATCIQWFPRQKGLVTGIAVAGFGGGAAAVSQIANALMTGNGASPYEVFRILGIGYMVVVGIAGLAMRRPPTNPAATSLAGTAGAAAARETPPRFRDITRQKTFQILYIAMFCGLMAGFAVNANLKELKETSTQAGVAAVSLFALANAAGRIGWGALFDRLNSPFRILQANLLAQALLFVASAPLLRSALGLQIVAIIAGFNYGGVLVLYASSVAARWGTANVGHIYGWMFSSNIPASLAPLLAGFAFDEWGSFTVPLLSIAVCLTGGIALLQKGNARAQEEPVAP